MRAWTSDMGIPWEAAIYDLSMPPSGVKGTRLMTGLPTARIDALLQGVSRKDLGRRVEKMSAGYRAGQSSAQVASRDDALAYLVARAPATYAAAAQVLERV